MKTYVKRFLWKKGERKNYRVLVEGKELRLQELEPSEAEEEERKEREEKEKSKKKEESKKEEEPAKEEAPKVEPEPAPEVSEPVKEEVEVKPQAEEEKKPPAPKETEEEGEEDRRESKAFRFSLALARPSSARYARRKVLASLIDCRHPAVFPSRTSSPASMRRSRALGRSSSGRLDLGSSEKIPGRSTPSRYFSLATAPSHRA